MLAVWAPHVRINSPIFRTFVAAKYGRKGSASPYIWLFSNEILAQPIFQFKRIHLKISYQISTDSKCRLRTRLFSQGQLTQSPRLYFTPAQWDKLKFVLRKPSQELQHHRIKLLCVGLMRHMPGMD